jgi:hypothetical protein
MTISLIFALIFGVTILLTASSTCCKSAGTAPHDMYAIVRSAGGSAGAVEAATVEGAEDASAVVAALFSDPAPQAAKSIKTAITIAMIPVTLFIFPPYDML